MKTVVTGALVIAAVFVFIAPAQAYYNWHGYPLNSTTANGSINGTINGSGGVYMDYVKGSTTAGLGSTADGNFTVPDGTDVKWAYLYFGIWGGTPCGIGWYNLTFNETTYSTRFIGDNDTFECDQSSDGANDDHYYNWGSTCGKWWVYYNVTDKVKLGADNYVNVTTDGPLWCDPIDSRIYGIVLVVVYDNTSQSETYEYQYWIKAGQDAFCHPYDPDCVDGDTLPAHDSSTTYYNGTADACNVTKADLTQVFLTAADYEHYYLEFNGNELDEGKLDAKSGPNNEPTGYFDFDTWDVTNYVESSGNNFWFHRDTDDYVSLTVSALVLNVSDSAGGKPDLTVTNITVTPEYANITCTVNATIANVDSTNKSCAFTVELLVNGSVNGTKTVPMLNPNTNTTLSFEWIPDSTKVYNITVVADSGGCINETNESNNTMTKNVMITDSPQPDLTVTAIYNDTVYNDGFTNTIIATIWNCNTSGWAGTFNVTLYNGSSTFIGNKTVKVLGPGKKVNVTFDWTLGSGGYSTTLNVTADSDNNVTETGTNESNNSKTKSVYVNSGKPPDLIVTLVDVPDDVYVNESNTINATIKNNGGSNVTWSFNTTLYVNLVGEDGSIVDYETVGSLNAGAIANVSYNWTPTAGGTYRLKVVVDSDDVVFESAENETNNHLINWSTVKAKKLYDFNTSAGYDKWAYWKANEDSNPPGSGPNIDDETPFTSSDLNKSDDEQYETAIAPNDYATHHFNFTIAEDSVSEVTVLWEGHGTGESSYVYIWNGTEWEDVGNNSATSDSNVSETFTTNCSDYINASTGYLHLVATSKRTGGQKFLKTDYVKVEVIYTP